MKRLAPILLILCVCMIGCGKGAASNPEPESRPTSITVIPFPPPLDVPFISQIENACGKLNGMANCGPASLAMVAQYFGQRPAEIEKDIDFVHEMRLDMTGVANRCGQGNTWDEDIERGLKEYRLVYERPSTIADTLKAVTEGAPCICAVIATELEPTQTDETWFAENPRHILILRGVGIKNGDPIVYVNDPLCYYQTLGKACTAQDHPGYYTLASFTRAMEAHGMHPFAVTGVSKEVVIANPKGSSTPITPQQATVVAATVAPTRSPTPAAKPTPTGEPLVARRGVLAAYVSDEDGHVYLHDSTNNSTVRITEGAGRGAASDPSRATYWDVQFSPDGRALAYVDATQETMVVVDIATGNKRSVGSNVNSSKAWSDMNILAWSNDGARIAFARSSDDKEVKSGQEAAASEGIWEVDPKTGEERRLAGPMKGISIDPKYSPTGEYLSFSEAFFEGVGDVYVVELATGKVFEMFGSMAGYLPSKKVSRTEGEIPYSAHAEWQDDNHVIMDEVTYVVEPGLKLNILSVPPPDDWWVAQDSASERNVFAAPLPSPDRRAVAFELWGFDNYDFPEYAGLKLMSYDEHAIPRLKFAWDDRVYPGLKPLNWSSDSSLLLCTRAAEDGSGELVVFDPQAYQEIGAIPNAHHGDLAVR